MGSQNRRQDTAPGLSVPLKPQTALMVWGSMSMVSEP
jgi:hypothetical protein